MATVVQAEVAPAEMVAVVAADQAETETDVALEKAAQVELVYSEIHLQRSDILPDARSLGRRLLGSARRR